MLCTHCTRVYNLHAAKHCQVRVHESAWVRGDGGPSDREHLLMALADLDYILIRAVHSPLTRQAG